MKEKAKRGRRMGAEVAVCEENEMSLETGDCGTRCTVFWDEN